MRKPECSGGLKFMAAGSSRSCTGRPSWSGARSAALWPSLRLASQASPQILHASICARVQAAPGGRHVWPGEAPVSLLKILRAKAVTPSDEAHYIAAALARLRERALASEAHCRADNDLHVRQVFAHLRRHKLALWEDERHRCCPEAPADAAPCLDLKDCVGDGSFGEVRGSGSPRR